MFVSVKDFGAVGDGVADDTTACQAAINSAAGHAVRFPAGTFKTAQLNIPSNTTVILDGGAVIQHNNTGAVLRASGVQSAMKTALTVTAGSGAFIITAPGHGLVAGDMFRLGSNKVFDASSTGTKYGELCIVDTVSGDNITATTPIAGAGYDPADGAYVQKITPVTNINILGPGTIRGMKSAAMGQYGIDVLMGRNILISGVRTENIDRRHIYISDSINVWVEHCVIKWAVDNTMAYGLSFANAVQDSGARFNDLDYVRHAFTTNNESAYPGIPRRILFSNNTVRSTSKALGGSMAGGDAIDSHTAAEDIWIEHNNVLSSSGQGINVECRTGRIIGNKIRNTASYGISVHNESDLPGRIAVLDNEVRRGGNTGIYVRAGLRGTTATYEYINVSNNVVADITGNGVAIGAASATTSPQLGITATGNTAIRASGNYALFITNASGVTAANNKGVGGATAVSITDSAPVVAGDDPGYLFRGIVSDAVTVTPAAKYLVVDTEGGTATDNLTTISGGSKGQVISVRTLANARDVAVLGTGNIRIVSAITLDAARDSITLGYDGTNWIEQARADFPAA
ncbi:glycosyl hydrolase family 28-related protein [Pseudarthrobacter sp. NamB4]|uniref:glycosyl hydrolase family 28-related protein n=1 Tax=Pseudarthrobacter sp. NamB4 TaxID=2576837 RepID=UPI001485B131|nr:glycosyl hydrolase family 28-related protein [Pseudarthrobacter sp. NamB4]